MGIFKSITKVLKKAAPIIGGAIGFSMGTPFLGTALGTGIGTLVAGGDAEDAVKAGLMGGIAGYAGNQFFGPAAKAGSNLPFAMTRSDTAVAPTFISKVKDFATSGPGIATIAGLGTLGALGMEEEPKDETKIRDYPKGEVVFLGSNKIYNAKDDRTYDLNDKDDREAYFKALLEQDEKKRKKEDDDEVVTMRSGGLNMLGETINRGLHNEIKGRADQIGPFLDQVGDMAQEKFGVDVTTDSGLGGGLGGIRMGSSGPATTILEGLPKSDFPDIFQAYLPMDQGEGLDQFGKPMETTGSTTVPTDPAKALELLGNAFNRGVSSGSGPFGAGASRLSGIGAMRDLFMNNGGEVEGPGTGTSDSVPARLSDGEFVLTAKAVRGAGGGDRDLGAARMYDMMSQLERIG
tara:strand:+ start:1636 stop:2850 length:1215 start_codon:yes stop_codon:yes gene_type:complete